MSNSCRGYNQLLFVRTAQTGVEMAKTIFNLGDQIRISPPIWPEHKLDLQPGDLEKFVPSGNGVYGYGSQERGNPFTEAPLQEACGGVIYFGSDVSREDFDALLRIIGMRPQIKPSKDYAVFIAESEHPCKDGYLSQMRIVSKVGLRFMFDALTESEYEAFPEQGMSKADALWTFIQQERERWGTSFMEDNKKGLRGLFGGDGDYAREELSFGFMLENDYHSICRIWSRAWLVTK